MRLFQINTVSSGSTGRVACSINKVLNEYGHTGLLAYGRGDEYSGPSLYKFNTKNEVYRLALINRINDKHGFGYSRGTKRLIQAIRNFSPDIIQLHNIHGYYLNIEMLFNFLREYNRPVVWTLHDCWSFTGHCAHFDLVGCERWKTECYHCPQKEEYPASWVFDSSTFNYRQKQRLFNSIQSMHIIAPSHWLKNLVEQSFLKYNSLSVIHNGIDLECFRPREGNFRSKHGLSEREFTILGVSNIWNEKKGLWYFNKLFERLHDDEKIILIGVNEKQKKYMNPRILTIGRTNSVEELAEAYSSADVFVNPSLEDVFATVNLEALACGTPVITFQTGGNGEALNEKSGYIVEKKDLDGLVVALREAKGKQFKKEDCIAQSKQFDAAKQYLKYLELYNEILEKER